MARNYTKVRYPEVYDEWGQLECLRCCLFRDLALYYRHPTGRVERTCKICHREDVKYDGYKAKARLKYATDPVFRAYQIAKAKAWNAQFRAEIKARRKALRVASHYVISSSVSDKNPCG